MSMSEYRAFSDWEKAVMWLRAQPDKAKLVVDAYYDDPLIDAATRYWRSEEWCAVRAIIVPSSGHALDVGAGRGIASFALAKDGFAVSALEPDPSALVGASAIRNLAAESELPIIVTQEFSERLPFDDAQFDVVFARAVLHHTSDLRAACREFFRVLKPGGQLIAIREHVISRRSDLPAFLDIHPLHKLYGGENAFLLDEYSDAIREAGFQLSTVLSPLESEINFAPHTLRSLQAEICDRIGKRVPGAAKILVPLLKCAPIWEIARRVLKWVDHRPGRLYSFIATRLS
jgi:SAM-dependent methyltransferase